MNASEETAALLGRIAAGDHVALDELLARHRAILRRYLEARLDPRLHARLDASDVVQETQMEVARRIGDFLRRQPMPFHLWLRKTAYENLLRLRRQHVLADCRSVAREVALPDPSSVLLARKLLAGQPPDQRLLDEELARRVRQALAMLDETDREVVLLRTLDGLDNREVAQVLDQEPGTASKRYARALLRLRRVLRGAAPPGAES